MTERIQDVRPPTPEERVLAEASKSLDPERSLERVETAAKFVFANVAAVATVLSGLGFVTNVGGALDRGPQMFGAPLPVVLVAGSLILATVALTPAIRKVRRNSLTSVARYYERQILRRGTSAILAMVLLAVGLAAAVDVAADDADPGQALAVSGQVTGAGKTLKVKAGANVGGLVAADTVRLRATAQGSDGKKMTVCLVAAGPGVDGRASAICPVTEVPRGTATRVIVTAVVSGPTRESEQRRLVLTN